ncbi:MAG TPA: glucose-6-phosphate isomerase family protein [Candidatus Limnocylindrales bacterium]|nr:glucose-6-phosphate isomerase family protein [Candidatus Limnocylindrales bacterium]
MQPSLDPFTILMDLRSGMLDPLPLLTERRVGDMRGQYAADGEAADELVYRVLGIPVPETNSEIQCSTTILEPGLVGDEYFMTKGHFHEVRDRSEVYLGLAGEGRLLLATEDGQHRVEPLRSGTVNYIPGGWAHRSINVGSEPLVFFAVYVGDAGHDYGTIEERGFPVRVVRGEAGPVVVPNERYRR